MPSSREQHSVLEPCMTIWIKLQTLLGAIYSSAGYYRCTHTTGRLLYRRKTMFEQHIQQAELVKGGGLVASLENTHTKMHVYKRNNDTPVSTEGVNASDY